MLANLGVVGDVARILKRRRWYFLATFLSALLLSLALAFLLPKTYVSTGTIAVESQQIPEDFVRSTITTLAGERVGMMEARVMTSARLQDLVVRLGLYREDWKQYPKASLADRLRSNALVEVIRDPFASRLGAIAFTISFEHESPEMAQAVATELVEMFLAENVSTRTERAAETTDFLERKAEAFGNRAREIDREIAAFKQKHQNTLPEHLELKLNMVSRIESDLRSLRMEIFALDQERRSLRSQRAAVAALSSSEGESVFASPAAQLDARKSELAEKSLRYKPGHWDIRRLKTEIAALEAQLDVSVSAPAAGVKGTTSLAAQSAVETQIGTITKKLALLRDQEKILHDDIGRLQEEILAIPEVEIELRRLTDQYNVYMEEYSEIRAKRYEASLAQSLEQEKKAERFVLLEPPQLPLEPVRSTAKMVALALVFSLGAGAGMAYLAELLDDRIYGRKMLASLTGEPPLAVIPYIEPLLRDSGGGSRNVG
ncbi:GumC family protein [Parahaliea mediterranea]|uniref:Polysaccharide chain length determinant N-terminal domain-containing protein n=1 Tax=Parahaliea mediterranea TaxID=651086 RepID=A0A939DBS3_9GAMM|nr:Wzz/FepE/Etk N-terminal domain-containing protein [Parahaliea mediterranea]MBN7795260.1 hypothetical protein [Parahaliea mediterranea]